MPAVPRDVLFCMHMAARIQPRRAALRQTQEHGPCAWLLCSGLHVGVVRCAVAAWPDWACMRQRLAAVPTLRDVTHSLNLQAMYWRHVRAAGWPAKHLVAVLLLLCCLANQATSISASCHNTGAHAASPCWLPTTATTAASTSYAVTSDKGSSCSGC